MLGGEEGQELPELAPGDTTSSGDGTVAATTSTQHVTQVAEGRHHVQRGTINDYLGHRPVDRHSLGQVLGGR